MHPSTPQRSGRSDPHRSDPLTRHQGALSRTLLHQNHVLEQRAVGAVPAGRFSQVGGQVERRAEGERGLQTSILLGGGDLQERGGVGVRQNHG